MTLVCQKWFNFKSTKNANKNAQNQVNLKYIAKFFNNLPKWWNFAKSGHTDHNFWCCTWLATFHIEMFDFWADPVVHLFLFKSSMVRRLVGLTWKNNVRCMTIECGCKKLFMKTFSKFKNPVIRNREIPIPETRRRRRRRRRAFLSRLEKKNDGNFVFTKSSDRASSLSTKSIPKSNVAPVQVSLWTLYFITSSLALLFHFESTSTCPNSILFER